MKNPSKIPQIIIILILLPLFYLPTELCAQIFTNSGRDNYNFNVEAGYQISKSEFSNSSNLPKYNPEAKGLLIIVRANESLLYGTFGKYKSGSDSYSFLLAGVEAPVIPFVKSFGRNEIGILVSLFSDYAKWERPSDSSKVKFDISALGINAGGMFKLKISSAELTGKLTVGYGYSFQYIGEETGNEWNARFSTHILFPNVTDYFGLSGSIFANYTNWDIKNDDLKTTILTVGITAGVAF